jgi:hypothetical protein
MTEILRTISITDDGGLLDGIGSEVDMMPGDPVLRERITRLAGRDCARRKLLWMILPLISAEGRIAVRREIATWTDKRAREAGQEILSLAGWPTLEEAA